MNENDKDDDDVDESDIALHPGNGSDTTDEIARFIPQGVRDLYEIHSYRHAAAILSTCHNGELAEILAALTKFKIATSEIKAAGGNESVIVRNLTALLRQSGWRETRILADLNVTKRTVTEVITTTRSGKDKRQKLSSDTKITVPNFVDGHKVDFVKDKVAFDLEWNSKDQTFDRDLYAFRAFYECGVIGCAVLLTRSAALNSLFASLGKEVAQKYGASTTWMGKLLYRINAGRSGGCPVLVLGITPNLIIDR